MNEDLKQTNNSKNILKDSSFAFAISCINLYQMLLNDKKEYIISKQVLRSGTSIGANIREAQNTQSTKDFIHKLYISQKECDETIYWLELLHATKYITEENFKSLKSEADILLKMLKSAILTTKQKYNIK